MLVPIPATDEQAKAVQEVAKVGGKGIDLIGGAGAYLARIIGTIPDDLIGRYAGDAIAESRKRNKERLAKRAGEDVADIAPERLCPPSPSLLLPLLAAAEDEGREPLQDIWAALLANCMVDGGRKVRVAYFDIVKLLEPTDALVLKSVADAYDEPQANLPLGQLADHLDGFGIDLNECQIALSALLSRGLLVGVPSLPTEPRLPIPQPSPLGRGLIAACRVA